VRAQNVDMYSTTTCTYGGFRHFDISEAQGCDDLSEPPPTTCEYNSYTTSTCVTETLNVESAVGTMQLAALIIVALIAALFFAKIWK